jgi:ABC-type branched-subunit amino acid transport system ATPase component
MMNTDYRDSQLGRPHPAAPEPARPRVQFANACLSFGGNKALDEVSLEIGDQEREECQFVGLLGTNGSGKSTLANVLSGYYQLTSGQAWINGRDVTRLSPPACVRLGVRRSFQNVGEIDDMTVSELVSIGWEPVRKTGLLGAIVGARTAMREERSVRADAIQVLESAGLAELAHRKLTDCPYGVRKLADLLRVMGSSSGTVGLLDEPTSGVADEERHLVVDLLRDAAQRSSLKLVIVIDHDVKFVRGLCEEVVVLESGKVIAQGATDEVLDMPRVRESFTGVA